ncbi:NAD(P)H-quinone oxidoreductase subunit U chloroplastic [Prunus yedoensis var. nudiflora]|uniref:NAD(P)H-quinone oxidoreductase subunit U chloroplastic n=1 Tax=Prunus yedoensis var. nudiflora TaxID=2094558 RepID=A0A314UK59_PRUYE|nr:NAD(P)H-quinone oxidoreductase subunit U chloroplastic [Prunus yedoensis var. nudiflora]
MAVSSSASTIHIAQKSFAINPTPKNGCIFSSNSIRFASKPRRFCIIRSSSDVSAETATTEADSQSSIEVPQEPPSLISALNVERALRGIPITDVDHYGRLGLRRGCSYDEVSAAYKAKLDELKNQGLDEEELNKNLVPLKVSFSPVYFVSRIQSSSGDERRLYDWSLARSEKPDTYVWPYEVEKTRPAEGTPPPVQEPDDPGRQDWWDTSYWDGSYCPSYYP